MTGRAERAEKVREMKDSGMTQAAIAERIGVSVGTVAGDLRKVSQGIVERVSGAIASSHIPSGRMDQRQTQAEMMFEMVHGRAYPREYRILSTNLTSSRSVLEVKASLASADVDMSDDAAVRRVIWRFIESMDARDGHRA